MDTNANILPQILATLSHKPDRSDNIDDLCDEVKDYVDAEYPGMRVTDISKAINNALEVGQSLGIISITNKNVRLPFNFGGKKASDLDDSVDERIDDSMDDAEVNATKKTSRRKRSSPTKRAPLTEDDSQYLIMALRRNSTKNNHMSAMDRMGRRRSARASRPRRASSRRRVSRRRVSRRRR